MSFKHAPAMFVLEGFGDDHPFAVTEATSIDEIVEKLEAKIHRDFAKTPKHAVVTPSKSAAKKYNLPYEAVVIRHVRKI